MRFLNEKRQPHKTLPTRFTVKKAAGFLPFGAAPEGRVLSCPLIRLAALGGVDGQHDHQRRQRILDALHINLVGVGEPPQLL